MNTWQIVLLVILVITIIAFVALLIYGRKLQKFQIRLPRILLSALVGGSLAFVGAVFQGLFRNPLADPHILGISSGAALGATIAILFGIQILTKKKAIIFYDQNLQRNAYNVV